MKNSKLTKHKIKASLTLEAALVLPIFIFAIIAFIYLLQIFTLHNSLQEAITDIGLNTAKYGYIYDDLGGIKDEISDQADVGMIRENEEGLIDSVVEEFIAKGIGSGYYKIALAKKLDADALKGSSIKNGLGGIHTYLSSYMNEDNEVDIILNYQIKLPLAFISVDEFNVVQRARLRGWNGYQPEPRFEVDTGEEEKEDVVYITATGTVYHSSKNCSHIRLSTRNISFDQVGDLRNKSGGKYKNCHICGSRPRTGNSVYITNSGDRYHNDSKCSGLKRTVTEITISEASGRNPCKRCGK